jgi:TolB-like protein
MADVFISYAREDKERVKPVVDAIEGAGYSVWWDRRIGIGRSFDREIERELDSCACVVVIWSSTSVESDWVRNEAQEGLDRGILVPVILDDVKQPLAFRRVQAAQFFTGDDQEPTRLLEAVVAVMSLTTPPRVDSNRGSDQQRHSHGALNAIAVLPFDDLSPTGDLQWLAEGLAEDLIDSLSRVHGLRVPAKNSTSALKEQKAGIEEIGDRLAVGSLITGSVRQLRDQILIAARWIKVEDQTPIWSGRFEQRFEEMMEIQSEITDAISEAVRKELGIHDTAEFVSRGRYQTSDVRAWEAIRKGFNLVFTFKPRKMAEGREYLLQALEIDPDYLEAKAWLAWSDFDRPEERNKGSIQVLQQQPTNPVALCALIEDSETQWDFETAESLWRYAVANNPVNNLLTLVGFHLCTCLGALSEALEVTRRGVRIDPLWPAQHFFLGLAHLNAGKPDAAIDPIRKAIGLRSEVGDVSALDLSWANQYLAIALHGSGLESDAIAALSEGFPRNRADIEEGASANGWHGANMALLRALGDIPEGHPYRRARVGFKAAVFASVGERELMYEQLSELMGSSADYAVRDREAMRSSQVLTEYLKANAEFKPYSEEPEFKFLRRQLDERIAAAAGRSGYADLIPR